MGIRSSLFVFPSLWCSYSPKLRTGSFFSLHWMTVISPRVLMQSFVSDVLLGLEAWWPRCQDGGKENEGKKMKSRQGRRPWMDSGVDRLIERIAYPRPAQGVFFLEWKGPSVPTPPHSSKEVPSTDTLQGARPNRPEGHRFSQRILQIAWLN